MTVAFPFRATINGLGVTVYQDRYEYDDGTQRPRETDTSRGLLHPMVNAPQSFYRYRAEGPLALERTE